MGAFSTPWSGELVLDTLHNVSLDVEFIIIGQPIYLVNENFDVDVWVRGLKVQDGIIEPINSFKIFILGIDDPNQGADLAKDGVEIK